MKECDVIGQWNFLYFYYFSKVLPHIRAIWYTDFGKQILINKTKARVAMDFSFTVIFGTMCTFLYVRTVIQATLAKHVMHILHGE
jgi:hypothetical protein